MGFSGILGIIVAALCVGASLILGQGWLLGIGAVLLAVFMVLGLYTNSGKLGPSSETHNH